MSSKAQRSLQIMGSNIWAQPMSFGLPLGLTHGNVVAYSSEYSTADERRFGDDDYESEVAVVVSAHKKKNKQGEEDIDVESRHEVRIVHRHKASEWDPQHPHELEEEAEIMASPQLHPPSVRKVFNVYSGAKFQCVEFARRYLIVNHLITFPSIPMAYHILMSRAKFRALQFEHDETASDIVAAVDDVEALRSLNGGLSDEELNEMTEALGPSAFHHHRPCVGSLLIWGPGGFFRHTGHVAVVVGVDDERIHIAEQNVTDCKWPEGMRHARSLPLRTVVGDGSNGTTRFAVDEIFFSGKIWGWVTPASLVI